MPTAVTSLIITNQHHQHLSNLRVHAVFISAAAAIYTTPTRILTMTSSGNASKHNKNMMILRIPGPLELEGDVGAEDVKEAAALISARRDSGSGGSPPPRHHHYHHHHHHHRFQSPGADYPAADSADFDPEPPVSLSDPLLLPRHGGGRCDVDGRILMSSRDAGKNPFENNNTASRGKEKTDAVLPITGDDDDDDDDNNTVGDSDDQNETSSASISSSPRGPSASPQSTGGQTKTTLVIPLSRDSGAAIESGRADKNSEGCDTTASKTGAVEASVTGNEGSSGSGVTSSTECASDKSETVSPSSGGGAGEAVGAPADGSRANATRASPSAEPEIVSVLKRKDSGKKRDLVGRSVSVTEPSAGSEEEAATTGDKSTSDVCDAETIPHATSKRRISFPADSVLTAVIQDGDAGELLRILTGRHGPGLVAGETGRGVDVQQSNHVGLTALHHAVLANNLDAAKLLLCHGADVNAQDVHGFSPLHTAAACGFLPLASLLVLFGADVFSMTSECELPVDLARDVEVVRVLTSEMTRLIHQELWLTSLLRARAEEAWLLVRKLLACVLLFVLYVVMGLKSSWSRKRSKTD